VPRARRVPSKSRSMNNSKLSENLWFVRYACPRAAGQVAGFPHRRVTSRWIKSRRIVLRATRSASWISSIRNNWTVSSYNRLRKNLKAEEIRVKNPLGNLAICLHMRRFFSTEMIRGTQNVTPASDVTRSIIADSASTRADRSLVAWRLNPSEWKLRHDLIQVKERERGRERDDSLKSDKLQLHVFTWLMCLNWSMSALVFVLLA